MEYEELLTAMRQMNSGAERCQSLMAECASGEAAVCRILEGLPEKQREVLEGYLAARLELEYLKGRMAAAGFSLQGL